MSEAPKRAPQARNHRDTPEGPERRCSACTEWWPEDASCFNRTKGGWMSWCRACVAERRRDRPVNLPAAQASA